MRIELDDVSRPQVLALRPFGTYLDNDFSVSMSLRCDAEPQRPDKALDALPIGEFEQHV